MNARGVLLLVAASTAAVGLASGGGAAPAPSAAVAPAAPCQRGTVPATIGGRRVCLRAGQPCRKALDRQYHRYRFHCHGTRLTRTAPATGADLLVAMERPPDQATVAPIRYAIRVTNLGPQTAQGVVLAIAVTGGTVVSAAVERGECGAAGTGVSCRTAPLPNGGRAGVALAVRPAGAGEVAASATASATTRDPRGSNNTTSTATTVFPGDSVRGEGVRSGFFGGAVRFAIDAWSGPRGEDAGGSFRVSLQTDAGVSHASGEVVCLAVAGNRAAVGAVVEETDNGAHYGRYAIFLVTDDPAGRDTSLTLLHVEPPGGCDLGAYPEVPLEEGDFVVFDAP